MIQIENSKVSRKEQIYDTAIQLFKERGYNATGMREIAKALDIKAASLYSHIKSKDEILQKICFEVAHDFFNVLDGIEKSNFTGKMRLEAAITAHISVIAKNKDKVAVFLNEWKHMKEPYLSDFVKMRMQYEDRFKEYLKYGMNKGEFDIDDLDFTVLTILASLNWTSNWFKKDDNNINPEKIAKKLSSILIKGIS